MPSPQPNDCPHSFSEMFEGVTPDREGKEHRLSQREWVKVLAPKIGEGRWPTVRGMPHVNKAEIATQTARCAMSSELYPMSRVAVTIMLNVKCAFEFHKEYGFGPIVDALQDLGWIHPDDSAKVTLGLLCDSDMPLGTLVQVIDVAMAQEEVDDDIAETIKRMATQIDAIEKRLSPEEFGKAIAEAPLEAMDTHQQSERTALRSIRESGGNTGSTASWMQKWAAWGLEPDKWPRPSEKPPSDTHEGAPADAS